jgi:hypothetical protein
LSRGRDHPGKITLSLSSAYQTQSSFHSEGRHTVFETTYYKGILYGRSRILKQQNNISGNVGDSALHRLCGNCECAAGF